MAPRSRASSGDAVAHAQRGLVLAQVDPDHEAPAADLRHLVASPRRRRGARRAMRIFGCSRSSVLSRSNDLEAGDRRRAGERVAGEGVAVEERAVLLVRAEEAVVDALGGQGRRQRQVAARQALAEAEEVGRDPLLLAGEHRPGAAETGRDLVADQKHAVAVAELAHRAQVARRLDADPGGALDQRLDDHRGDLLAVLGRERPRARRRPPAATRWASNSSGRRRRGRGRCRRRRRLRSCRRGSRRSATTNAVRSRVRPPRCCQYWNAIFSAISVAVEPASE